MKKSTNTPKVKTNKFKSKDKKVRKEEKVFYSNLKNNDLKKNIKMFVKVCLLAFFFGCIMGLERGDLEKFGAFQTALNSRILTCVQNRTLNLDVSGINVYFFDFANNFNKSFPINDAAEGILNIEDLDSTRQFIMFVGGFTSHINHVIEQQMREAYKTHPNSYLIIPDHSAYTNNNDGNVKSYGRSVTHIHYIGKALGQMWAKLNVGGISAKNIHCVGHSLGGQILGHVGSTFFDETGEKISRITALDPAGPCFATSAIEDQVRSGVAEYVEIYHCNAGALGSSNILGDVDFIVNKNGASQPSCGTPIVPVLYGSSKAASCAHRICVDLWTASVKDPELFMAYSCESYDSFKAGNCMTNEKTVAGSGNPGNALGVYYLSTVMYDLKTLM